MTRPLSIWLILYACSTDTLAEWIVPEISEPLSIEVEGSVEINRASVQTIRTGSPDAIVSWLGQDGMNATFGATLIELDTEGVKRNYQEAVDKLTIFRNDASNQLQSIEKELAEEEEDLKRLLENLAVQEARARAAARPDPSHLATLEREIDLVRRQAKLQEAELHRMRNQFEIGELPRVEIEDAELSVETTRRSIRIAEIALEEAEDGSDAVLARRAAWQVERARLSLGVDENGNIEEDRGYARKVAAVRGKYARTRASLFSRIDASEVEIQGFAKAAWPHFPLRDLRILQNGILIHRLQATNEYASANFTPERGWGWLNKPTFVPAREALVVRGEATWQCDLPDGSYQLECTIGDDVEWNCMIVRHHDTPIIAVNRLTPSQVETYTANIQVKNGKLTLKFGLPQKAVLASVPGTVKFQTWISLGRPIHNNPPALYLTPTAQLLVRFRIHHLQIPFFEEHATAQRELFLRNSQGQWIPGGAVRITDDPIPFFSSSNENSLRSDDEIPEERTAREVTVAVPSEYAEGFGFSAHTLCRATATPKDGTVTLPTFLIDENANGLFVQTNKKLVAITGTRFDQRYIVEDGVSPGMILEPPSKNETKIQKQQYTGEVVSGSAVPIVVPTRSWARIEDLVPHGSRVTKDQVVITLYRPKENERAVMAGAKAIAAEARFLTSMDTQFTAFLRETSAHAQSIEEEKLAADRVSENRRQDLTNLATAEENELSSIKQLSVLNKRVLATKDKESTRLAFENYSRQRDILELQTLSSKLAAVTAFRKGDYTLHLQDLLNWQEARKELEVREAKLALNLEQEEVLSQRAKSILEDNLEDHHLGQDFETMRFLKAPSDGHVFYLKGYNDLAKRNERIEKEFVVWNGLTVAQVLDMSNLSFKVSLPEHYYKQVKTGMKIPIQLEDLGEKTFTGTVTRKGRSLHPPKRQTNTDNEPVKINRVFDVMLAFTVPEELEDALRPGLRGAITLP